MQEKSFTDLVVLMFLILMGACFFLIGKNIEGLLTLIFIELKYK